jgi:hypothetical protein
MVKHLFLFLGISILGACTNPSSNQTDEEEIAQEQAANSPQALVNLSPAETTWLAFQRYAEGKEEELNEEFVLLKGDSLITLKSMLRTNNAVKEAFLRSSIQDLSEDLTNEQAIYSLVCPPIDGKSVETVVCYFKKEEDNLFLTSYALF